MAAQTLTQRQIDASVAVSVIPGEDEEAAALERWHSDTEDVLCRRLSASRCCCFSNSTP